MPVADAWRRLHRALREAAADGFAGVMRDELGEILRTSTDELVTGGPPGPPWDDQLARFREGLHRFEERGRDDRSRVVAHGLRICMGAAPRDRTAAAAAASTEQRARKKATPKGVRGRKASPEQAKRKKKQVGARPTVASAGLSAPVDSLTGVGPKLAERMALRGIECLDDLLFVLPIGYQDRRQRHRIDELVEGQVGVVEGVVRDFRQSWWGGRFSARMKVEQRDANSDAPPALIEARWFHPVGGLSKRVETGAKVILAGPVTAYKGALNMVHPEVLDPDADAPPISVRYPNIEGVPPRTLLKAIAGALAVAHQEGLEEVVPPELAAERGLPGRLAALEQLHTPSGELSEAELQALFELRSPFHRRLVFEELFLLQLGLLQQRREWRSLPCACPGSSLDSEELRAALPFEPTGAQWRALDDIAADLGGHAPMLRLLQGDVGSGKTAVAFGAALAVVRSGGQVALMAPTGILAEQHLRTLEAYCKAAGVRLALLTGATPRAQRATTLSLLAAGRVDLLVGTHALLVSDVQFARLGLVIVDEQHRFGVEQRTVLREKGDAPHLLVMTATPIPRSLALTAFGELDVSVIDELPPGRSYPDTKVFVGRTALTKARAALAERVRANDRAFVVCPLVEASEAVDASDVEATAAALRELMPRARVGVVHGRMADKDKDGVMRAFRDGELDVLVATTVIEVGVDVPDARAILVEHAERFGLAQLHQLRGRVGRGGGASTCLLHTAQGKGSDAHGRLEVLEASADGFAVAERDLSMRGPGELFGTRQAGAPNVRLSGLAGEGLKIVIDARDAAQQLLETDPTLRGHPVLREALARRLAARGIYSGDSG